MRAVETQWWIIELPDEWDAEQEDDAIVISDEDGVGEIVLTTLQKETGMVTDEELVTYTQDVRETSGDGEPVSVATAKGYYFSFLDGGEACREWYLRCDNLLILATYCCDADNAGMDDSAVDEILATLFIKTSEDTPAHD